MEATGVYWITLYDILETADFDVYLVVPQKVRWFSAVNTSY